MPETILWYYFTLQNYYKKREHSNFLTHNFLAHSGGGVFHWLSTSYGASSNGDTMNDTCRVQQRPDTATIF